MIPIRLRQRPAMVGDVPLLFARLDEAVMAGPRRHVRILLQDFPDAFERAKGRRGGAGSYD